MDAHIDGWTTPKHNAMLLAPISSSGKNHMLKSTKSEIASRSN